LRQVCIGKRRIWLIIYDFNYYVVFFLHDRAFSIIANPPLKSSTIEDCWKISILVNKKLSYKLLRVCMPLHLLSHHQYLQRTLFYILQFLSTSFDIWTFISTKNWKVPRAYKIQATHYNFSNVLSTFSCSLRLIHGVRIHFYL
jgi:hypothetical protein